MSKTLKIRLIGDHSAYHCGSAAAFAALRAEAAIHGTIVDGGDYDLLVVNGEGSMHHASKGCRRKMQEIETALAAGRRVRLVNTVWQENPPEFAEILKGCEEVVARESASARTLADAGVKAMVRLDQSYFLPLEEVDSVSFNGAMALTDFWSQEFASFARITSKWAQGAPYIDMTAWTWSALVRALSTASLLVTGRHHAVYAACRARTPFLALEGNTHKISGLIETSGVDIPVFTSMTDLRAHFDWPAANRDRYDALFDWMESQPRWRLTDAAPVMRA